MCLSILTRFQLSKSVKLNSKKPPQVNGQRSLFKYTYVMAQNKTKIEK